MASEATASHVVVLSGGLDSTVCTALAEREGGPLTALTFDYGQRHRIELDSAKAVAAHYGADPLVVSLDASAWGGSALTDPAIEVPPSSDPAAGIPITYVPARNLIFLSVAMGVAEARGAALAEAEEAKEIPFPLHTHEQFVAQPGGKILCPDHRTNDSPRYLPQY